MHLPEYIQLARCLTGNVIFQVLSQGTFNKYKSPSRGGITRTRHSRTVILSSHTFFSFGLLKIWVSGMSFQYFHPSYHAQSPSPYPISPQPPPHQGKLLMLHIIWWQYRFHNTTDLQHLCFKDQTNLTRKKVQPYHTHQSHWTPIHMTPTATATGLIWMGGANDYFWIIIQEN